MPNETPAAPPDLTQSPALLVCSVCRWMVEPCAHVGRWLEEHGPAREEPAAPSDETLDELERLEGETWVAPWVARTFEVDCPCPNGEDCGDMHSCEEVEAPEAYPDSHEEPAPEGEGQCVVQISVPGLESLSRPTAQFIAAARNALPALLAEVRRLRGALQNVRMLAASRRAKIGAEHADHLLRFCREVGIEGSPLHAAPPRPSGKTTKEE